MLIFQKRIWKDTTWVFCSRIMPPSTDREIIKIILGFIVFPFLGFFKIKIAGETFFMPGIHPRSLEYHPAFPDHIPIDLIIPEQENF